MSSKNKPIFMITFEIIALKETEHLGDEVGIEVSAGSFESSWLLCHATEET